YLFEAQAGDPTHVSALIHYRDGRHQGDRIVAIDHDLTWDFNALVRTLVGGELVVRFKSGSSLSIDVTALRPRAYLQGGGYGVDQGNWKGESHLEHETWDLSDPERLREYIKGSSD